MSADNSQLTLTFIDRVEKKIKSPEKEHVCAAGENMSSVIQEDSSQQKKNQPLGTVMCLENSEDNTENGMTMVSHDGDHHNNTDRLMPSAEDQGRQGKKGNTQSQETTAVCTESDEHFIDRRESKLSEVPQDQLSPSKLLMELQQTQQAQNGFNLTDSVLSSQEEISLRETLEDSATLQKDDASLSNYYARGFDTYSLQLADKEQSLDQKEEDYDKKEKSYEITSTTSVMLFQERNLFEDEKEFDEDSNNVSMKLSNYDLELSGVSSWRSETLVAKQLAEVKAIPSYDDLPEVEVFPALSTKDEESKKSEDDIQSKNESVVTTQLKESKDNSVKKSANNCEFLPVEENFSVQENRINFTSMDGSKLSKLSQESDAICYGNSKANVKPPSEETQKSSIADDTKIFSFTDTKDDTITKYSVEESSVSGKQSSLVLSSKPETPAKVDDTDPQIVVTPATPRTPNDSKNRTDTKECGLNSPSVFTVPTESHIVMSDGKQRDIICEEDEENVIIHFESELDLAGSSSQDLPKSGKDSELTVESELSTNNEDPVVEQKISKEDMTNKESENICVVNPASALEPSPLNAIEVERKFRVTRESVQKLSKLGASLLQEKKFTDIYYDDSKYSLTLSDWWLRQRNQCWELKISKTVPQEGAMTYEEITDENKIVTFLVNHFKLKDKANSISMTELMQKLEIFGFATFTTTRQSFALPECTIDLDITDFGFQVGEIEVMVASESRIPAALSIIEDVANKLGVPSVSRPPGKISVYLYRNKPDMYSTLVKANCLIPVQLTDPSVI